MIGIQTPYEMVVDLISGDIPSGVIGDLPKKWEKIGDILILRIPESLSEYQECVAAVYADVLNCRSVLNEYGIILGVCRTPQMTLVYGDANTETVHIENSVRFRLDPQRIMFSSGNIGERKRMAMIAKGGEQVVDLFAGIGYFTIPMAVFSKPKRIIACEINPVAFGYLLENTVLNDVSDVVEPVFGDNQRIAPKQWADRVLLGYLDESKSFLPTAFQSFKTSGGVLHYHDIYPKEKVPEVPFSEIIDCGKKYFEEIELLSWHIIKSYAPGIVHVVLDVDIR